MVDLGPEDIEEEVLQVFGDIEEAPSIGNYAEVPLAPSLAKIEEVPMVGQSECL